MYEPSKETIKITIELIERKTGVTYEEYENLSY